jgi:hypothetical protein
VPLKKACFHLEIHYTLFLMFFDFKMTAKFGIVV